MQFPCLPSRKSVCVSNNNQFDKQEECEHDKQENLDQTTRLRQAGEEEVTQCKYNSRGKMGGTLSFAPEAATKTGALHVDADLDVRMSL